MILRLGKLQLRVYISILKKRVGVCSQQYDKPDTHMLLWDFDGGEITSITNTLMELQIRHKLPSIAIVQSSANNYHAYCFSARSFRETISILAATPEIDIDYLRLGVTRGFFTLRITPRKDEHFELVKLLYTRHPREMSPLDVTVNEYLTSNNGGQNAKR